MIFIEMSEIAKSSLSNALTQTKQAISECQKPKVSEHAQKCEAFPTHAQEHGICLRGKWRVSLSRASQLPARKLAFKYRHLGRWFLT